MSGDRRLSASSSKGKRSHNAPKKITKNSIEEEIASLQSRYPEIEQNEINLFKDLPLSAATLRGLEDSSYTVPTKIQKESIGLALQKFDILGAAKTGSGKTLAFLIPLLECLFCNKWSKPDGVGALIITPTRELALQIFETLRKIGRYHDFSAGLVIGGKDLKFEKSRMDTVNIVVCTPGRLLQHLDENPLFNCDNLKILILDEADRCLDMGFEATMNAIIENLPVRRQTLLFSATQTRSVRDLARLSLKDPKYVAVHELDKHKTPEGLAQSYIVCELHEKITVLWSFIMSHLQNKILVFFSTCHQVRFVHEVFKQLHPRTNLMALHGKMHQLKRMDVYKSFCNKKHAVLFATDIAARGLDFPEVHWVVQLDCPEDVDTYIHRAGRTARYHKDGECLLILSPSETAIVERLESTKIPINKIKVNSDKMFSPQSKIEAILAKKVAFKEMAQRAFVSYVKSVFLMKDKSIFDVKSIDLSSYSRSLGLVVCPRVRFLKKHFKSTETTEQSILKKLKNKTSHNDMKLPVNTNSLHEEESGDNEEHSGSESVEDLNPNFGNDTENLNFGLDNDDDDILTIKRRDHELSDDELPQIDDSEIFRSLKSKKVKPKASAKKILKKKLVVNKKIVFSETGEAILDTCRDKTSSIGKSYELNTEEGGIDIQEAKMVMREEDKCDKELFKERLKQKKKEMKQKRKEMLGLRQKQDDEEATDEASCGEESDSSGPDLSWLPDPDKVYRNQQDQERETDYSDDSDEDKIPKKKFRINRERSESESDDNVSLKDEEEFALHLLSKGK